jgi:hypothetical protein
MNKLLTTITLLCFSVAANANVYVCDSTVIANVGIANLVYDEAEIQDQYILDTEAGMLRKAVSNGERLLSHYITLPMELNNESR